MTAAYEPDLRREWRGSGDWDDMEVPIDAAERAELRRVAARTTEALQQALGPALDTITAQDTAGFFRHAGYGRPN